MTILFEGIEMRKEEEELRKEIAKYLMHFAKSIMTVKLESKHKLDLEGMSLVEIDLSGAGEIVSNYGIMDRSL